MAGRKSGIIETWELWRKTLFFGTLALMLFLAIALSAPIGILIIPTLVLVSKIWRPIGVTTDSNMGEYRGNTRPHKLASFFMAYKSRYKQSLYSPLVSIGMGPPREDKDHEILPGWLPMTRLSSYWSLFAALILGLMDYFTAAYRFPFWINWADFRLPGLVMYILSVIGFYIAIQSIVDVRRIRADKTGIVGTEVAPAVILSKISGHIDLKARLKSSLIYGMIPPVLVAIIWAMTGMPAIVALSIIVGLLVVTFLLVLSRAITDDWRAQWLDRMQKRETWDARFEFLRDKAPIYVGEQDYPTYDEYLVATEGQKEPEPYQPFLKVATFLFPQGGTFDNYIGVEPKINGSLNARLSTIAPIGKIDPETGREETGTTGSVGFRVWWSENEVTIRDVINPKTNKWVREFGIRALVLPAIHNIRGLGYSTLLGTQPMTRLESTSSLVEIKIVPPPNVNLNSFLGSIPALTEGIGTPWVGVNQEDKGFKANVITMMFGDDPAKQGIKFVNPPRISRKLIHISNWSYYMHVNGVVGQSGTPRLLSIKPTTEVVDQLLFELPKGTPFELVQGRIKNIAETSGNDFIEASVGDGSTKKVVATTRIEMEKQAQNNARFTVIAARSNPLERAFPWEDYKSKLLLPRTPGQAQLSWSPGILANDEIVYDNWSGDLPHLLFGGASGMGKSQLAMSMLMQLVHNNGPEELQLHLIEPKNELQTFENVDICKEMVDSWTPDDEFMYNAAESATAMVKEMNRVYRAMRDHPRKPKKLEKAREIALREGPQPDGSPHPLMFPFRILFMEECATLFADAGSKEESQEQKRLIGAVAELARKSRAAGIHLVAATQYPTNASIPSVIRNQMRRIGLGCQNRIASDVVIGQNDLAGIRTPGLGMLKPGFDYRKFRGYWIKDGDTDNNEQNDIEEMLKLIPSNQVTTAGGGNGGLALAKSAQRVHFPDPDSNVFNAWESKSSRFVNDFLDGKGTKDITEDDIKKGRYPLVN